MTDLPDHEPHADDLFATPGRARFPDFSLLPGAESLQNPAVTYVHVEDDHRVAPRPTLRWHATPFPTQSIATDPTGHHFVLVKTRAAFPPMLEGNFDLLNEILAHVDRLNKVGGEGARIYLRGLYWDNARGNVTLWIDLQHEDGNYPPMTTEELAQHFGHRDARFGGQSGAVEARIVSVSFGGDLYTPFDNEDYLAAKEGMYWKN